MPLPVHPAAVYLDSLGSDRSKAAINQMLCALQRVLKEALRFDLIDPLDYSKAVDVRSIKQSGKQRGWALRPWEIAALMSSCGSEKPVDVRDAALITILRGAECAVLKRSTLNGETSTAHFAQTSSMLESIS